MALTSTAHCGLMILLVGFSISQRSFAEQHPANMYADLPAYEAPQLSPSGERLAYFMAHKGRRHLVLQKLAGGDPTVIPPWNEKVEIVSFFWKTDEYIVLNIYMSLRRNFLRTRTDESRTLSYHLPSRTLVWLGKTKRHAKGKVTSQFERVVDRLVDDPEHILIQADFEFDAQPDVYKANLKTGRRTTVQREKAGVNTWYSDQSSQVRLGVGFRFRSERHNVFYKTSDGDWLNLEKQDWFKSYEVMGFSEETDKLYVSGLSYHGTLGVFLLDVLTGEVVQEVFSKAFIDVGDLIAHPVSGRMIGVSYTDDYWRQEYFDEDWAELQKKISKPFPGQIVTLVSKAQDQDLYLVKVNNDSNPGDYYFYNPATNELRWFINERSKFIATTSASTIRVDIPMRDASSIPAYITWPATDNQQSLPVVVLPHGGPFARDTQTWDYQAQYYASLGYLVLKPNFRGSTGYGPEFQIAGEYQWGGRMQDDVTDATRWLISEGLADPKRICIVGASYGGYAALMGAIKEPELYRCSIAINAVTNLLSLKARDRRYIGGRALTRTMGLTGSNDKQISPYHQLERIEIPVLLMASKDDARIPMRDTVKMHKRLIKKNKQSKYVEIADGTHYLLTASSRRTMLKATGEFLQEHLSVSTAGNTENPSD